MDESRFDDLLRSLSASPSRRSALRLLGALALGGNVASSFEEAKARTCPVCKKKKHGKCKKLKDGTPCSPEEGVHGECVSGHCCLPNDCTECPNVCATYDALTECRPIFGSDSKFCCRPLQEVCEFSGDCCMETSYTVSCRTIANKGGLVGCGFMEPNTATRCCIPAGAKGASSDCDCCDTAILCEERCIPASCDQYCTKSCTTDTDCGTGCYLTCQEESPGEFRCHPFIS